MKNRNSENVTTTGLGPIIAKYQLLESPNCMLHSTALECLDKSLGKTAVIGWELDNIIIHFHICMLQKNRVKAHKIPSLYVHVKKRGGVNDLTWTSHLKLENAHVES